MTNALPAHPSAENLRKRAKSLARKDGVKLAAAQHRLARDHGFANWAALMRAVAARRRSALGAAAAGGDADAVRALLAGGAPVDGAPGERAAPLYLVCDSGAPAAARIEIAGLLIAAGAHLQRGNAGGE